MTHGIDWRCTHCNKWNSHAGNRCYNCLRTNKRPDAVTDITIRNRITDTAKNLAVGLPLIIGGALIGEYHAPIIGSILAASGLGLTAYLMRFTEKPR